MRVYKELSFGGDKLSFDTLFSEIYNYFPADWSKPKNSRLLKNYIVADYIGDLAPHAEVSIYYGADSWREGYIQVGNIVPLDKDQLTIDEYNKILELFYTDIVIPYCEKHTNIKVFYNGPQEIDHFFPMNREDGKINQKKREESILCHEENTHRNLRPKSFWRYSRESGSWEPLLRRTI